MKNFIIAKRNFYIVKKKPFKKYIYIKKCCHCDLKYLGIHNYYAKTPMNKYPGSGDYWSAHLKYHKCKETNLFLKLYTDEDYYYKCCNQLSEFLNIVEDNNYANLCPETGKDGYDTFSCKSVEEQNKIREKLSFACSGEKNGFYGRKHTGESKKLISKSQSGKNNNMYGKTHTKEAKKKCNAWVSCQYCKKFLRGENNLKNHEKNCIK